MALLPLPSSELIKTSRKYPTTLVLLFVIGIAGYFLREYTGVSDSRNNNCVEEKQQLIEQGKHKDSVISDLDGKLFTLQQQLLITNGVLKALPGKVDSLNNIRKKTKR